MNKVVAVHACVIRTYGTHIEYLSPTRRDGKGDELAPGGGVEACDNEDSNQTLMRELQEEYNIDPNLLDYVADSSVYIQERGQAVHLYLLQASPEFEEEIDNFSPTEEVVKVTWKAWGDWTNTRQIQVENFAPVLEKAMGILYPMLFQDHLFPDIDRAMALNLAY